MQRNHYNTTFTQKQFPIVIICDNISNAANIGSLLRAADAFGVEKIIFCGDDLALSRKSTRASRSAEKVVAYELNCDIQTAINSCKESNYQIIALEITTDSIPLNNFKVKSNSPIALIIGDENFGVSESILDQCHNKLHINMYGQNSSMNVVQATSIALYEITKQLIDS
ncbi:RNA methyltransferase [Hanstruepera neustonica]|uniref:RNA methyltransferase n=1 Tax=Hanstruepera neustonica TaxID=1445657 RepID=A0A2K1DY71_9FLAO|nr:TrmH family RNA methyltransferase [Hanstruepera neustonica]PNQ72974.1 RNA methyltransferase [Hanstruepera neustonica]